MKIKYKFVDGTVAEIEVEDSIGAVITESRHQEGNLARKESYHCYSLEAIQYEGTEYSDGETPETKMEREMETERIAQALDGLSEVQRRRLLMPPRRRGRSSRWRTQRNVRMGIPAIPCSMNRGKRCIPKRQHSSRIW